MEDQQALGGSGCGGASAEHRDPVWARVPSCPSAPPSMKLTLQIEVWAVGTVEIQQVHFQARNVTSGSWNWWEQRKDGAYIQQ